MIAADSDGRRPARDTNDGDRRRARYCRAVSELAIGIRAPALDRARDADSTTLIHALASPGGSRVRPESHLSATGRDRDRRTLEAAHHRTSRALAGATVAELAEQIRPPARDGPGPSKRTRMELSGGDSTDVADHGRQHRFIGVVGGSVAKLAIPVRSPAHDAAIAHGRARVEGTGVDLGNAGG